MSQAQQRICVVPRLAGVGGMVSFQARLAAGMAQRGVEVVFDLKERSYSAVLVVGGTRQLAALWRVRREGIPVIQRLDGMNWVHRLKSTGLRHALRAEMGNWLLNTIRTRLATHLVYQSRFAQGWWERTRGPAAIPSTVIHNAVDLDQFSPQGDHELPAELHRLLLVEGSLMGGYEMGLETAVALAGRLAPRLSGGVELVVVGRVADALRERWEHRAPVPLRWAGLVPRERIPFIDRSAHLLYSGDINAACPNAVIEALACGLPVVAYDTGALPELVGGGAGRVVPYGANPWKLEPPDLAGLADAAEAVLRQGNAARTAARRWAEAHFGLDAMLQAYLRILQVG